MGAVDCKAPRKDVIITDVTADSRKAGNGVLFVCVKGRKRDGNDYINEAIGRGAAAIVTDDARRASSGTCDTPVILVDDARKSLSRLCARFYCGGVGKDASLVAVTGTNGKTTTAHMMAHILSSMGYKTGIVGTVGTGLYAHAHATFGGMTTPDPERFYREIGELCRAGAEYIIIEASSHGIAQGRLDGLPLTGISLRAAAFTNLSAEHMDFHVTMEDYFLTKSRLFSDFGFEHKIINIDGEYGERLCCMCDGAVSVGRKNGAMYRAVDITHNGADGVRYVLKSQGLALAVRSPIPGSYTVDNSALALATVTMLGADPMAATEAMSVFRGVRGRMERIAVDRRRFAVPVYIDFAHTPEALRALLGSVREAFPTRRIVTLFGCGGDRDKTKRAVMGRVATTMSDHTVITSDNSRGERTEDIISDILTGVLPYSSYSVIKNRADAIQYVIMNARDDDVILLVGKGHEEYEDIGGERQYFDERGIVMAAIEKRSKLL